MVKRVAEKSLSFLFGIVYALYKGKYLRMADIDFIRLAALVFAARLIGHSANPVEEATQMANELFYNLKEKEA